MKLPKWGVPEKAERRRGSDGHWYSYWRDEKGRMSVGHVDCRCLGKGADALKEAEDRGFDKCNLIAIQQMVTARAAGMAMEREKIKSELLKIADKGEIEDLRREVEKYFKNL